MPSPRVKVAIASRYCRTPDCATPSAMNLSTLRGSAASALSARAIAPVSRWDRYSTPAGERYSTDCSRQSGARRLSRVDMVAILQHAASRRKCDAAAARRQSPALAVRSHEEARSRDRRGDRSEPWTLGIPRATLGPTLVPGVRLRTGVRLALERGHDNRLRRAQGRSRPAEPRARHLCRGR